MPESNVCQAMIPVGASVLWNPIGTAPGLHYARDGRQIFLMPGVPREMERMMSDHVLPALARASGGEVIHHLTLRTSGISESALFERIRDVDGLDRVASLPKLTGIDLRVTVRGPDEAACRRRAREIADRIRDRAGEFVYAEGEERFERLLVEALRSRGLTVAVAEAGTGGGAAHRLAELPEADGILRGAVVAGDETAVADLIGLPPEILRPSDRASGEIAEAMARGVRQRTGAEVGLAATGAPAPEGGAGSPPADAAFVAVSLGDRTFSERHVFLGDRAGNRERTAQAALDALMKALRSPRP
jgi:nicotinamide-nucleotide amidase